MRTVVWVSLLALAGCASGGGYRPVPDGPPLHVPGNLATLPDPVPKDEPRSKRGNPASYTVRGKTYYVMASAEGYRETGEASWYGRKFHGRLTSSGEPFDMFKLTAAHKSLPIPAYVRVTNLLNGKSTIVRVNDRGPFHGERIIDLSYAAAVKLDFHRAGTAPVRVELVRPSRQFMLQAGAFSSLDGADRLKARLAQLIDVPSYVVRTAQDALYRVHIGPVDSQAEAERIQSVFEANALGKPLVIER